MSVLICFVEGLKRPVCVIAQLCLTLWDPMDCSLPGFSVHGILQARILEWAAIPFFWGSSQARDQIKLQVDSLQFEPPRKPIEASMKAEFVLSSFSALLPFLFLFPSSSFLLSILQYLKGLCEGSWSIERRGVVSLGQKKRWGDFSQIGCKKDRFYHCLIPHIADTSILLFQFIKTAQIIL